MSESYLESGKSSVAGVSEAVGIRTMGPDGKVTAEKANLAAAVRRQTNRVSPEKDSNKKAMEAMIWARMLQQSTKPPEQEIYANTPIRVTGWPGTTAAVFVAAGDLHNASVKVEEMFAGPVSVQRLEDLGFDLDAANTGPETLELEAA